jgi:hypothetical protein
MMPAHIATSACADDRAWDLKLCDRFTGHERDQCRLVSLLAQNRARRDRQLAEPVASSGVPLDPLAAELIGALPAQARALATRRWGLDVRLAAAVTGKNPQTQGLRGNTLLEAAMAEARDKLWAQIHGGAPSSTAPPAGGVADRSGDGQGVPRDVPGGARGQGVAVRSDIDTKVEGTPMGRTAAMRLQDDPEPDADDEDLAELLKGQPAGKRRTLSKIYRQLRGAGGSHAAALHGCKAALACEHALQDPQPAAPNLPPMLAQMVADMSANNMSGAAADITARFRARYTKESAKVARDIALQIAANDAITEARRLLGLIGPKDQADDKDDPEDVQYMAENRQLAEDVAARVRSGKGYDQALAEAKAKHPERVERIARGYRTEPLEASNTFTARDTMAARVEQLMAAEGLDWTAAYNKIATADQWLHEAVVAEMRLGS